MDLLLWRHAEAEDGFPDEARKLTPRGEQQAKQMAKWINKHAPKELRIIASPALRCQPITRLLSALNTGIPFLISTSAMFSPPLISFMPRRCHASGERYVPEICSSAPVICLTIRA